MIKAQILADSKNEFGNRITTMLITFPRIILAEFNTHRMFSRNSASSRAIPFEKMVRSVEENPFIPIAWQRDHKGMQGSEYITDNVDITLNEDSWLRARNNAISEAKYLNHGVVEGRNNGVTKQLCNRLLEPFIWHTCIVTATEWENFFALRCPQYYNDTYNEYLRSKKDFIRDAEEKELELKDNIDWLRVNKGQAEIHMMALAEAMWDAYNESTPKELKAGEWHIPFEEKIDKDYICIDLLGMVKYYPSVQGIDEKITKLRVAISTVMCARVSYTTLDTEQSEWTYEKYIVKHDELANANPKHMSPFEHCARAMDNNLTSGNFNGGWLQYRKTISNENII